MLAAKCKNDGIRLSHCIKCFVKMGEIIPCCRISVCIDDLCLLQFFPQLFQKASALRLLDLKDPVKLFRLIALDLGARNKSHIFPVYCSCFQSRDGICNSMDCLFHTQMRVPAEETSRILCMTSDDRQLADLSVQRKHSVIFQKHHRFQSGF